MKIIMENISFVKLINRIVYIIIRNERRCPMLEWIDTFLKVYELKSFSLAAQSLFIAQPTVSSHIKKLEDNFNTPLFLRNGKQEIIPTPEADFLYPRFLQIRKELNYSIAQMRNKENFQEDCILACSNTTAITLLPPLMKDLMKAFPMVNFIVHLTNSKGVAEEIYSQKAHLGLLEKPINTAHLKKEILFEDELVLAGNKTENTWILREKDSGIRFYNELYLNEHDLHPRILQVDNNEVLIRLLEENVGQSIISKLSLTKDIPFEPMKNSIKKREIFLVSPIFNTTPTITKIYQWLKDIPWDTFIKDISHV